MIIVTVLKEAGYEEALLGISLSHGAPIENMPARAEKLAHKGGGHSKFLESMMVWIDVIAPRYWWAQADTYRISTKQSESTMHTICKRHLCDADFVEPLPEGWLETLNCCIDMKQLDDVKRLLPESFLQRRIWLCSYKELQAIYSQRNSHKLLEWRDFCDDLVDQLQHPEFLCKIDSDLKADPVSTGGGV